METTTIHNHHMPSKRDHLDPHDKISQIEWRAQILGIYRNANPYSNIWIAHNWNQRTKHTQIHGRKKMHFFGLWLFLFAFHSKSEQIFCAGTQYIVYDLHRYWMEDQIASKQTCFLAPAWSQLHLRSAFI